MNKADFQLEQGERQMAIAGGIAPSSCTVDSIVGALQENVETLVTCTPIEQHSASEPRSKLVVTGPTRLVSELAWRLSPDSANAPHDGRGTRTVMGLLGRRSR